MYVVADVCIIPLESGVSLSPYVAEFEKIFEAEGLKPRLHGYGTNIEGEWDAVLAAVKRCHEKAHAMGAVRISSSLRLGTRTDRAQTGADKIASVEARLK